MNFSTPDLCDQYPDSVCVLDPILRNMGGKACFGGEIVTVKCHEDNSILKEQVSQPGAGKVMVVDGGGSRRCALLGDMLADQAVKNAWEGFVIYGCIRDIDEINQMNIGVAAIAPVPIKSIRKGRGDLNIPLAFGGVCFRPGAYVYADNNGVIAASHALMKHDIT